MGIDVVRRHDITHIVSTSPPVTCHVVAHGIKAATDVHWVADLRDSWLEDPRLRLNKLSVRLKRRINTRIANRTLGDADALVTATPGITRELAGRYPNKLNLQTILNGVDLADFEDLPDTHESGTFLVVHAGGFFGKRTAVPFLDTVRSLLARRPELADRLRIRFVGTMRPADQAYIDADPVLTRVVECTGFVTYGESLAHQASADLLLLLLPPGQVEEDVPSGKLFEYLGAGKPILASVPTKGIAADMIRRFDAGVSVEPDDTAGLIAALEQAIDQPRRLPKLPDDAVAEISREDRARSLRRVLELLV
jgi:glycosyltransferase involved in cell wall biosynthesis